MTAHLGYGQCPCKEHDSLCSPSDTVSSSGIKSPEVVDEKHRGAHGEVHKKVEGEGREGSVVLANHKQGQENDFPSRVQSPQSLLEYPYLDHHRTHPILFLTHAQKA